jgi:hypothetical protein
MLLGTWTFSLLTALEAKSQPLKELHLVAEDDNV